MAIRNDFAPGEVLAAADLNDTFGSKLDLAGGKILQIVRATDATNRSSTSTSFVDVTGMSVTITPQKSDSAILIMAVGSVSTEQNGLGAYGFLRITDSSNNAVSGAENMLLGSENQNNTGISYEYNSFCLIARATPATTSAVSFKLQFKVDTAARTITVNNSFAATGQMYAIEVSA
jgi:hypothetical protein